MYICFSKLSQSNKYKPCRISILRGFFFNLLYIMFKIYFIGFVILLAAILLNGLINKWGIIGWYDFINQLLLQGKQTFRRLTITDYTWLFLLYPFLLGLAAKAGDFCLIGYAIEFEVPRKYKFTHVVKLQLSKKQFNVN